MTNYSQIELQKEYKRRCKENKENNLKKITLYKMPNGKVTDNYSEAYGQPNKVIQFLASHFFFIIFIVWFIWAMYDLFITIKLN